MLSSTLYVQQAWNSQQESELILGKLSWRTWLIANTFAHSQTQPQAFIFFPPSHADLRIIVARGRKGGGKSWCTSVFLPHSFLDNKERKKSPQTKAFDSPGRQARVSCSLRVIHLWSPPIFLIFASPCPALWMSLMDAHFFHSLSCGHTLWRNRHSMTIMRQPQISTGAGENGNKSTKPSANPSFVLCADCLLSGKEGSFPVPRICHSKFSLNMV